MHPMPDPGSPEAPVFTGDNLSAFLRDYYRLCTRKYTNPQRAALLLEDYCVDSI